MKLNVFGGYGKFTVVGLTITRPKPKILDPKSTSQRAWNGQNTISRYCPFRVEIKD